MENNAITLKEATKSFKAHTVLNGVTLGLEEGKIHGIIGRNGSGKTVLLKCLCGFMRLDKGEVTVNGQRLGVDGDIPRGVGIIIETPGFLPQYSGYTNLRLLARIQNTIGKEAIRQAIGAVGLDPMDKKHVGKYSLGMRQRLAIAQAVMENPSTLILDEPMNGLDKQGLADMRAYFMALRQQGKTILLASHSAEDIDLLCDTVHEIDNAALTRVR